MNGISLLVERAIAHVGSQWELSRRTGVGQSTVHKALYSGRVGIRLAQGIETATNGKISKSALRPDVWPPKKRVRK